MTRTILIASGVLLFLALCAFVLLPNPACLPSPSIVSADRMIATENSKNENSVRNLDQVVPDEPRVEGDITDLAGPADEILQSLPSVEEVAISGPKRPASRIIHILDQPHIPRNLLKKEIETRLGRKISDLELRSHYSDHLIELELLQDSQLPLLSALARYHGLSRVFIERLPEGNLQTFEQRIDELRSITRNEIRGWYIQLEQALALEGPDAEEFNIRTTRLIKHHQQKLIELGAACRLLIDGKLQQVLPLDDTQVLDHSNYVQNGKVKTDHDANRDREWRMVQNAIEHGPVAVLLMDGAYNLTDVVPKSCQYIRVRPMVTALKLFDNE